MGVILNMAEYRRNWENLKKDKGAGDNNKVQEPGLNGGRCRNFGQTNHGVESNMFLPYKHSLVTHVSWCHSITLHSWSVRPNPRSFPPSGEKKTTNARIGETDS